VNTSLSKMAAALVAPLAVAAAMIATEAHGSVVSPVADLATQQWLNDDDGEGVGPNTGPDPNFWNGGEPTGGTGMDAGPGTGTGDGYFDGGQPAGGTGIDNGPDTGTGPGIWDGGESAGEV
jgi:hypothetical protein